MEIISENNQKIKDLAKLNMSKYRKEERKFLVEGAHLVDEARKANVLLEAYSIKEKEGYIKISESAMKKLAHTATVVEEIGVCKMLNEPNKLADKILILDAIQDPGNLGSLMRSAKAFGFNTIIIRSHPDWIPTDRAEDIIRKLVDIIIEKGDIDFDKFIWRMAATTACRMSVMAGDYISNEDQEWILENIRYCENPFTCPHGRPTIITYTKYELEKLFKRQLD